MHPQTKEVANIADAAHIVGFSEDGPRGEAELSDALAGDVDNLMLLCGDCHKTIDRNKAQHSTESLRYRKQSHEARVLLVTGVRPDVATQIVLYGANIGQHSAPLSFSRAAAAVLPDRFPAESTPISLGMVNSSLQDDTDEYWKVEAQHLRRVFGRSVGARFADGSLGHISVFGLAPQPLLVLLGTLLSDIPAAEVFQLHREPPDWRWRETASPVSYEFIEPARHDGPPALVLSLSATVNDTRVRAVLPEASIWHLRIEEPHNDFLQSREQLAAFRQIARKALDRIKAAHGEDHFVHLFPAVPVSIAIELGRVWMPKADLPLRIFDQNRSAVRAATGGFVHAIDIGSPTSAQASTEAT